MRRAGSFGKLGLKLSLAFAAVLSPCHAAGASPSDCLSAPYSVADTATERGLAALVQTVREDVDGFPTLRMVLQDGGPTICLSDSLVVEKAFFDPAQNLIVLADDMDVALTRAVMVHELRHVEQFNRGICPSDRIGMAAYARATLALEADANTVAMLVAWSAREDGDARPWTALGRDVRPC